MTPTTDTIEMLRKVPLFAGLGEKELKAVGGIVRDVRFDAGTEVCREGSPGVGLHIIVEGQARIKIGDKLTQTLLPGDFFGEIALLDGGTRTATVVAESPLRALSIVSWDFHAMLERNHTIALTLLKTLASRLRAADAALRL